MTLVETISAHLKNKELDQLKELLTDLNELELRNAIDCFRKPGRVVIFRLLEKDKALRIFESMHPMIQSELLSGFGSTDAAEYLKDLPADDRVRLLDELPAKVAGRLISEFPDQVRETTNVLLGYEPSTAGRLMNPNFVTVRTHNTVEKALDRIRAKASEVENPYVIYVTDDTRRLEGVLSFRDLVIAESSALIEDIMNPDVISVWTSDDQEEAARTLLAWDFSAVPVLDSEKRLVGIFSVHDAMDILEDETTEDIFQKAGLLPLQKEESGRSRRLLRGTLGHVLRVRLPFLLIALGGGMTAGAVIAGFEEVLKAVPFAAFFIPVIMDMGGNVGIQSTTIFTRGLVLGHIRHRRFLSNWAKEVLNGAAMGTICGILGGLIAFYWQGVPQLGLAVGIALAVTITVATALGFLIPWILFRAGLEQAAGSDPIITTLKDITGLLIYFSSVTVLLSHML